MTEIIRKTLRDSKAARWTALVIVAFTMLTGYFFTEVISPLKPLLESQYGWSSTAFGYVTGAYGWFNVFLGMLIIAGIVLDKAGIRFSTLTSATIMVIGAFVKFYSIKYLATDTTFSFLGMHFTPQVFGACIGYAIFGVGVEFAGITVSRVIVKWFKGYEMALAMGLEMACARLGTFAAMAFAPTLASAFSIPTVILIGGLLLLIGLISFIIYFFMDVKLDKQTADDDLDFSDEKFKFKDILLVIKNPGFWLIALLCVLFYSAVFPFYKYGTDLMFNKFGVPLNNGTILGFIPKGANIIPALLPFGTLFLTPLFGNIYDKKGKGATIMIIGAFLLVIAHVLLYLPGMTSTFLAFCAVIIIGIAFSLVPSAMWPSVPKIIPEKLLGTAYSLIFFIQNIGLMLVPTFLGRILEKTNPEVTTAISGAKEALSNGIVPEGAQPIIDNMVQAGQQVDVANLSSSQIADIVTAMREGANPIIAPYDYSQTWLLFIALSAIAVIFAFALKFVDKKKGYGLEQPNITKQ